MNDLAGLAKQVIDALKPLADKIGQGGEAVYRMAVKDVMITGQIQGCFSGLLAIIFVGAVIGAFFEKKETGDFAICGIICFGCVFLLSLVFPDFMHNYYNPEYMALKELLKTVR